MQDDLFKQKALYILDSSSIISLRQHYPKDIFGPLHKSISKLLNNGKVAILDLVLGEIRDKEPELHSFFKNEIPKSRQLRFGTYVETTQQLLLNYYDAHGQAHNIKADPHVVGCAKVEDLVIVTDELNSGITSIPYICGKEDIRCISFVEFLREEKIKLT